MNDAQQIVIQNHQPGFWSMLDKWLDNVLGQDVPMAVVLLIVVIAVGPLWFRLMMRWKNGPRNSGDDS